LEQVRNFLNDSTVFGEVSNLDGTIDMNDPFSNKRPPQNGSIIEVHDAKWYQDTVTECDVISNVEP